MKLPREYVPRVLHGLTGCLVKMCLHFCVGPWSCLVKNVPTVLYGLMNSDGKVRFSSVQGYISQTPNWTISSVHAFPRTPNLNLGSGSHGSGSGSERV